MYKKRQRLAKELSSTRSEDDRIPSPDPSEPVQTEADPVEQGPTEYEYHQQRFEVAEVYRPPPFKKQKKTLRGTAYVSVAAGHREKDISTSRNREGFKRAKYDDEIIKTLPKKFGWEELSDTVRKQIRDILKITYRKTLMNVAGTSSEGPSADVIRLGEVLIKPIAAQIDKVVGSTLFPNKVDDNLLSADLRGTITKMRKRLENDIRVAAEITVKVDEKRDELVNKQAILDDLIEKNKLAKEEQLKYPHRKPFEDPEDYVQMLRRYPSSRDYY